MEVAQAIRDPRPDLRRDSRLWSRLLASAWDPDPEGLFWPLQGMRCIGAALVVTPTGIALGRGEIGQEEYEKHRATYLMPYKARLIALLAELGKWDRSSMIPKRVHGRESRGKAAETEAKAGLSRG